MKRFIEFMREQGIAGLAIGFIIGSSVGKVTTAFVTDIVQPSIGLLFGSGDAINKLVLGPVKFGGFITSMIDLVVISIIIYIVFKLLKLGKLDGKRN